MNQKVKEKLQIEEYFIIYYLYVKMFFSSSERWIELRGDDL